MGPRLGKNFKPSLTETLNIAGYAPSVKNEIQRKGEVSPELIRHEKEPQPKLLSPDIFWGGGGLPREGVGAKKFGMSLETRETKLFWRDIPGFCWDIPGVPEKFDKIEFVFNFRSLA